MGDRTRPLYGDHDRRLDPSLDLRRDRGVLLQECLGVPATLPEALLPAQLLWDAEQLSLTLTMPEEVTCENRPELVITPPPSTKAVTIVRVPVPTARPGSPA
jgi:hypothetical protein